MRHRYLVLALSIVCVAAVLLFWRSKIYGGSSAAVAPYTAHLTVTENRVLTGGSSWDAVSAEVIARDRHGRISERTEHISQNGGQRTQRFSFFVQDPAKRQTLTWDSISQTAVLAHWPYWSGRKGCWADEHGQHQSRFPNDDDWDKVPASPGQGKLETIGSMADLSGNKRTKTRYVSENLGQKEIHGLTAYGMRWTITPLESVGPYGIPETTTELWKSKEFDLDLLKVTSGPRYGLKRVELSDLQRGDPDPELFEAPQGYKVETIEYRQVTCGQK